jgi:4-hydroxybenzoate polyprenyltransferase/phosphoserine phosphatase
MTKSMPWADPDAADLPLVVDVDGTLLQTDILFESFLALLANRPWQAVRAMLALLRGKAALKAFIAERAEIPVGSLPVNQAVLDFLHQQKAKGRKIYLASASDRRPVAALAEHLGLFDGVFASDGALNLAGSAKAAALCAEFGDKGFDYAGDSVVDLVVWRRARKAILVNAAPRLIVRAEREFGAVLCIPGQRPQLPDYVWSLRMHQWLKNLLIFVPALAAHQWGHLIDIGLPAFLSFSLCASSVYLLNDMLDLKDDRTHPTKCNRPFARGALPLSQGFLLVPASLSLAAVLAAWFLPLDFVGVLATYWGMTLGYSLYLKRRMLVDVVMLTCLYGLRILAGGVAMKVTPSPWLLGFSLFLFFSLALVKRCTELIDRADAGSAETAGRAYQRDDLPILEAMSAASGYAAVVVMALYINSAAVVALYRRPEILWFICLILVYWISRVLLLTRRGEMHDDPVVFAATDRISLLCGASVAAVLLASL